MCVSVCVCVHACVYVYVRVYEGVSERACSHMSVCVRVLSVCRHFLHKHIDMHKYQL